MEKPSRGPFRVVYQTPLFAYFETRPDRMDEYCGRFLTPEARATAEMHYGKPKSPCGRRSPIPGARTCKLTRALPAGVESSKINLSAGASSATSELQPGPSTQQASGLSTARLCNSRSEFGRSRHLKQRLIAALGEFGFPGEPDFDFQLVFNIFTAVCEEFYAQKQRYGSKMIQSVAYHFKVLKRLQAPCLDAYVIREYRREQKTASASILRSPRLVLQTVKMLDFEVYKRQLLNSGYQEIIDSMRARRKQRREQAQRALQAQYAAKQLRYRPLEYALLAGGFRK